MTPRGKVDPRIWKVIQSGGDAFHVERLMGGIWCWWDGPFRHRSSATRAMRRFEEAVQKSRESGRRSK